MPGEGCRHERPVYARQIPPRIVLVHHRAAAPPFRALLSTTQPVQLCLVDYGLSVKMRPAPDPPPLDLPAPPRHHRQPQTRRHVRVVILQRPRQHLVLQIQNGQILLRPRVAQHLLSVVPGVAELRLVPALLHLLLLLLPLLSAPILPRRLGNRAAQDAVLQAGRILHLGPRDLFLELFRKFSLHGVLVRVVTRGGLRGLRGLGGQLILKIGR